MDSQIDIPGVDHVVHEFVTESPHLKTDFDRYQCPENLSPTHNFDSSVKSLNFLGIFLD